MQKINQYFLDFIEIGTSDFDTEIQKYNKKKGISIDPIKNYINRLPNKKKCIKINCAISNTIGKANVYYIKEENIKKYNLPKFIKGCNSINNYHPIINKWNLLPNINQKEITEVVETNCTTLINIIEMYKLRGFYYLKIDTEGHDCTILEHFFNNYNNNINLPHKILFETNELTNESDIKKIINISKKIGYDLISKNNDTILKLNLNKIKKNNIFSKKIKNYYIENNNKTTCKNNLRDAKKYCVENNFSGITYENGIYSIRNGNYINYCNCKVSSWIYL